MKCLIRFSLSLLASIGILECSRGQNIVINEIMYHPSSQNPREEYIELFNQGPTNVNLSGWSISGGVDFVIPAGTTLGAGDYLVVAANRPAFQQKYPGVNNVVGNWLTIMVREVVDRGLTNYTPVLSNQRNTINLNDATGRRIDSVTYADEGDWAVRQRGFSDRGIRGWIWLKEHDGQGKSLELMNPNLPNEYGQNWAASQTFEGTPGQPNSVRTANIAPMILDTTHSPVVPRSSEAVNVRCRILNETAQNVTVRLRWRVDSTSPVEFANDPMFDDGQHADGLAGDGIYAAFIPALPNNTVVEFYVEATDGQNNTRTWPGPVVGAPDDGSGPTGQVANALYQVDDNSSNEFGGVPSRQPVYKIVLTENERVELAGIPCSGAQNSDAAVNATFISLDAQGTEVRYRVSVRNRGHASRCANPPNYRVDFVSDAPWKDITALNLNSRQVHLQVFGSTLAIKSGSAGAQSRAVQVRINNANLAQSGSPMFGSYAANEVYNGDWADRQFPFNGGGNVYKAIRDIQPAAFEYRGENPDNYRNTFFKETHVPEDDWTDLIGMLSVMGVRFSSIGVDNPVPFEPPYVGNAIVPEQWLTHLAVMSLMGNSESGINSGHNDDYYMYRGENDPRFILLFHDLDQLFDLGGQPVGPNDSLFGSTNQPPRGSNQPDRSGIGLTMGRFLRTAPYDAMYYHTVQRLLNTTFSQPQFDSLVDQILGDWVAPGTISSIKSWMSQRRTFVQNFLNERISGLPFVVKATISGEPRSPTPMQNLTLTVGGEGIVAYRVRLNNGPYAAEVPVTTPITLNNLTNGTYTVSVLGKTSSNTWQSASAPTVSRAWTVDTSVPTVRLNEVLARNTSVPHQGTFPDMIELYNEGAAAVDLSGLRLTDDPQSPDRFTFPNGTTLNAGAYLVLYANDPDGTGGIHLGFGLDQAGEGVYLFDRVSTGGALLDSVRFGPQIANLSIGRLGNAGAWRLTQPTFGSANNIQSLGNERNVRINEWLAAARSPFPEDFIELFNPNPFPVDVGGLYLTDAPIGAPALHRIPDQTFIAPGGYLTFTADGNGSRPDHTGFRLNSDVGEIGLFSQDLGTIDCVIYGPQTPGVAMGRCPDGGSPIRSLVLPTPGTGNACPEPPPPVQGATLMAIDHTWRYEQSGTDLGTGWINPLFNDSSWPVGQGFFGTPSQGGGAWGPPVNTVLTTGEGRTTFYFRTTFTNNVKGSISALELTHLIDDGAIFYLNGQEFYRYNMPAGPVTFSTPSAQNINPAAFSPVITLPPTLLMAGVNHMAVELHQSPASNFDIGIGFTLRAVTITNTPAGLVINEIFANNGSLVDTDGSTPDWAELYNPSQSPADLTGMALADRSGRRWLFPAGSIIPAMGYFAVRMDGDKPASPTNTGFGLRADGDVLTLYEKAPQTNVVISTRDFGLQTADFSIGRVPNGGNTWTLTLPTIGSPNLAASLGSASQLRINEWMANPPPGDDDWFEVYNPNPQPVDLSLCLVSDNQNTRRLPALSFIGANSNAWQRFIADDNVEAGADHMPFKLGASSDSLRLANSNGVPIDFVTFADQQEDVSGGRLPDGATSIVQFPGTASPGGPNFVALTNIVISEVLAHSDLPLEDAIELHNLTGSAINIGGWWLSDAQSTPRKFQIPAGTMIPARGFRVFYEFQFGNPDEAAVPFALSSASGDEVYLSSIGAGGGLTGHRASAEFGASANGVSFGRYRTSVGFDFTALSTLTLGTDVTAQSPTNQITVFRTGQGASNSYPKVGPIVISEIMYHPPDIGTNDNGGDEFLELRNITAGTVPLYDPARPANGWRLRDAVDFDFNSTHSIPPNGHLVVVSFDPAADPGALAAFRARYGSNAAVIGPYRGKLDNSDESVELYRPDAPQVAGNNAGMVPYILVDKVHYRDRLPWPTNNVDGFGYSLQRLSVTGYGNDPTNWFAALPAIGTSGSGDTDGDGMPDDWELAHGFDRNNPGDGAQDADGDGMTNLEEYLSGTDPRNRNDYLQVVSVTMSGGQPRIRFRAVAGKTYTLQYRNTLVSGSWLRLMDIPAQATTGFREITDPNATGASQRFYRLVTP